MKKNFNYLGFLSILSLIGLLGLFQDDATNLFGFFGFLGYVGYFYVTPDELFKQRVLQSAAITLLVLFVFMLSMFIGHMFTQNVNFFTNGFWISFTLMIVVFPIVFTYYQIKDGTHSK